MFREGRGKAVVDPLRIIDILNHLNEPCNTQVVQWRVASKHLHNRAANTPITREGGAGREPVRQGGDRGVGRMDQKNDQTESAQCTHAKQTILYTINKILEIQALMTVHLVTVSTHQMSALTVALDVSNITSGAIHLYVPLADLIEDPEEAD